MGTSMPPLSLCMTASRDADRVRVILEVMRPLVDEVVLGVDAGGDPALRELPGDLVDLVLPFESPGFGGGLIGWIQHQCSGNWILRLDEDEVPGASLLDSIPTLSSDRSLTHMLVPRRWLYPSAAEYVVSHPWTPDYQVRLVRNVPGLWSFGGRVHDSPSILGAHRFLDCPIYHADCLLQSFDRRRAKAERYERARPGHRNEGFPVNAMYLPEICQGIELMSVPVADAPLVSRLIGQETDVAVPVRRCRPARRSTPKDALVRFNVNRAVSQEAYRASVTVAHPRPELPVATHCSLDVLVRNLGDEHWPASYVDEPPIRLGCRWLDRGTLVQVAGEGRGWFPCSVPPGEQAHVRLGFETPATSGYYVLEVDVLHEGVQWFGCASRMVTTVLSSQELGARPRGADFLASYGLNGLDLRLVELLQHRSGGTFIEAGAHDGLTQSNSALLEFSLGWTGMLVEPVPHLADRCRTNRPDALVEQVALVPTGHPTETVTLFDCGLMSLVAGAMGSEDADREHLSLGSRVQGGLVISELQVPAVPLSRLIETHGLGRVDLLILDVEGYEVPTLLGLDFDRHGPEYLLIEARVRSEVDAVLGGRYSRIADLSHHDVLYRRTQ